MEPKTKTSYGQIVELDIWGDCAFCQYNNTGKAIVINKSLIPVCGRCAAELLVTLQTVADEDGRR